LEYAYCHIKAKQVERPLIAMPDTCLGPNAVMVEFVNTFSTSTAMRYSWCFPILAFIAIFLIVKIRVGLDLFILKLSYSWISFYCLKVAPNAHNNIYNSDKGHNFASLIPYQRVEMLYSYEST